MIFLWAATFAISQLLTPEPEQENAKAAGLDEFSFPTATEGRVIPLGWGTDKIKGSNVMWYGDLRAYPITEKIKTGMFSSTKVTVGHKYHIGFQMGICLGPVALRKIWIGDELVWSGNQTTDGDISISHTDTKGTFAFYTGSKTQSTNSYLATYQSPTPAYRGLCYGVWEGGYVGDSKSIRPWTFEVTRIPTGLGCTNPIVNTYDCNPMEMMYELLTSSEIGYGYPSSDINITEFQDAADTLYTEGNGMSFTLQSPTRITNLIKMIEKQIDGRFRIDPTTGKWRVVLARDGYSTGGLRNANDTNILEIIDFSRATWDQTVNSVRINYKRRANDYGTSYSPAQDGANMRIQNRVVPVVWTFEAVKDDALANKIAWRELRSHSYPLSKIRFKANRTFWNAYEGEVIKFSYTIRGIICYITDLCMRITRIEVGNKEEPDIIIDAVQDIFAWRAGSFGDQDASSWTPPVKTLIPFPANEQVGFEAPYAISRRAENPSEGRVFCSGVSQGRSENGFRIRQRNAVGTPSGAFFDSGDSPGFMWKGTLDSAIVHDDTTIDVLTDMDISEILDSTAWDVGNDLTNLFMIGDEFISCTGATAITGGLQLTGCYRGMLDSAQGAHSSAAAVYFIGVGGELTDTSFDTTYNVHIRLLPFDLHGNMVDEEHPSLTQIAVAMATRERRPYPPTFMDLNSTQYPSGTVSLDVQHGANEDTKGIKVEFNRRDFRIYDEASQNHTDAETIDPTFPAANNTQYAVEVWKDPSGTPTLLYTTGWQATAADYAYRSTILRHLDGVLPSELLIKIKTRHTHTSVVYEARYTLDFEFDAASSELTGDFNFGSLADLAVSNSWTAPDTGSYSCTIGHVNSGGPIQYRLNGGGWLTAIATSSASGSIPGVTANDTIEVRSNGLTLTGVNETIMKVDSPSSAEDAYAIFEV